MQSQRAAQRTAHMGTSVGYSVPRGGPRVGIQLKTRYQIPACRSAPPGGGPGVGESGGSGVGFYMGE